MNIRLTYGLLLAGLLGLAAGQTGCGTQWAMSKPLTLAESGLINDPRQVGIIEKSLTDDDIGLLLDADIRAKLPTSVALAGLSDGGWAGHRAGHSVGSLKTIGAEELAQWEKTLDGIPHLRGVQAVSSLVSDGKAVTLHSLRTAAAKMGCEMLLVYLESDVAVNNYNDTAILYWTFVGLWVVPGNTYEHRTVYQAILVDCRTGAILGTAAGDQHLKQVCPAAFGEVQEGKLAQESPRRAMADLQKACGKLLREVVAAAERPR